MKKLLLIITIVLFSTSPFAAQKYDCYHQGTAIGFTVDQKVKTLNFYNTDYLEYAQITIDHNFSYNLTQNTIHFENDWYYTAFYELKFKQPLTEHHNLRGVELWLTFDDADGAYEDNVLFQCDVKNI